MRARPSYASSRPASLDTAQRRAVWRRLAQDGLAVAIRAQETRGRELLQRDDFAHALGHHGRARFPVEHASADHLATAFRSLARALIEAGTDERRAIVAPALAAAARAVDELLTAQADADAWAWKRTMPGEGD